MDKISITIKIGRYEKTHEGFSELIDFETKDRRINEVETIDLVESIIKKRIFEKKPMKRRRTIQKVDKNTGDVLDEGSLLYWQRVVKHWGNIVDCCNDQGKNTTYHGFQWRYKKQYTGKKRGRPKKVKPEEVQQDSV